MLANTILRLVRNSQSVRFPACISTPKRTYFNWLSWLNVTKFDEGEPGRDQKFVELLNDPNIDGFDIRRHIMKLLENDLVPEPEIVIAAMRACRRVNDYALAIRILEIVRFRSGPDDAPYNYVMSEVRSVMDELGVNSLEELGFDKPNYWIEHNQLCR